MLSDLKLTGRDAPFVNNYGVWEDEFKELGLRDTLEYIWPDALCYFGEDKQVGRPLHIRSIKAVMIAKYPADTLIYMQCLPNVISWWAVKMSEWHSINLKQGIAQIVIITVLLKWII